VTTVGRRWYPVQNEDAFDFFTKFVEAGNMQMHTAGSLKGGEVVWAMAKLTDKFELFGGDVVEGNLLFTNPHQYGKGIDVRFTPIRVVCNNTLVLAQSKAAAQAVKMDHRTVFDAEKVTDMLNIASLKMSQYKEMASFIGSRKAERSVMEEYFGELLGRDKKDEKELSRNGKAAMAAIDVQPGAEYAQGTWWTAFNAITYMTDHVMGYRPDTRLQSAWYGPNLNLKYKALQKAVEYAAKSPDIERKVAA
jgi:phage/plasmid-like protein (TIGR03299 family)